VNKKLALTVALAVAIVGGAAVAMAGTSPGTISLRAQNAVKDTATIDWTWRAGSSVRSTSKVDILKLEGSTWRALATGIAITRGTYSWDTSVARDGAYTLRAVIQRTSVRSGTLPVMVDNTDPTVHIVKPSAGGVIVDDEQKASAAIVAGMSSLVADANDYGSGIASVEWTLDDTTEIPGGATTEYDFSTVKPGPHTLAVTATDAAGNTSSDSVQIVALPGPSVASGVTPEPSDVPVDPSNPPTVPVDPNNPPSLPVNPSNPPTVPSAPPVTPPAVPAPPVTPPAVPAH
jgi:hypothetical protein